MSAKKKTREQLILELEGLRRRMGELENVEKALRRSEEKFVKIFRTSPDAIAISRTSDGTYIEVNEAYTQVSGYSRGELLGRSPLPGDLNLWLSRKDRKHFAKALREKGEALGMEIQFRRKDGAIRNASLSARVLDLGGSTYHIAIISDITDRKRAEEALRKSEEKFSKIFRTSPDAIAVARTSDGRYLEVNEGFTEIMGYSREELLGRTPLPGDLGIWTHKANRDRFIKALKETDEALGFKVTLRRKDGALRDCLLSGRVLDIEGERCHIAIITDVTERRQAEDALRRSEERHRVIVQTAMDGFWLVDMGGRLLEVNEAYCRMSGYSGEELLTMDVADLEAKETRKDVYNHIQLLKSKGESRFESTHRRKDGSPFDVEVSAKYRPTEGGRFEVFLRDINDRKQSEKALKRSQDRLRALSARLQTVREEERASMAREIHDDLGQLLTGLKMDLSWFLRHPQPDTQTLRGKVLAMVQLVDQTVQTVRRISTELRPRILDDFGLVAALEWQAEEFAKKAEIPCTFRSNIRQLELEPDRSIAVFRIFQEALTNIVRHSRATKVGVSFKKNGNSLLLTIQDNGRGISSEEITNHHSLGLVGMRERALIFGGTVEIQGKNGKGTKIILRLPIQK
jgi:PAS domain S-box-containing protein